MSPISWRDIDWHDLGRDAMAAYCERREAMSHPLDQYTFILDAEHKPVQCANDEQWWLWYLKSENRQVVDTMVGSEIRISTVFTALALRPDQMLFETHVFGGEYDGQEFHTATWNDAVQRHAEVVNMVKRAEL